MISLELAAGSAVLPVDASHLAAGQAAWHAAPFQDSGHLGAANIVTPNDPPPPPKLTATLAGTVQFGAADSVAPDDPPPKPKLTATLAGAVLFGAEDSVTQDDPPPKPK
jgi:hypothetical protein